MKLRELRELSPDLSFGEILYSLLRPANLEGKPEEAPIAWLMDIDDFDYFNAITKLIEEETEFKKERENAED